MSFSDLPLSAQVVLFLSVFVLIGIQPALKRAGEKIRKLVHSADQSNEPFATLLQDVHADVFAEQPTSQHLNDFEIIVLQRLAQSDDKALSRKQLNTALLLDTAIFQKTLRSLHRRGLIRIKVSTLLGQSVLLSEAGRQYAIEQGYIIKVQERKGAIG
ncbi:MAG: hypothetical protein IH613_16805 [Desulfuromonadales bacterium]|nr:hypothetical protein [Desulfuromonadales bacterium]